MPMAHEFDRTMPADEWTEVYQQAVQERLPCRLIALAMGPGFHVQGPLKDFAEVIDRVRATYPELSKSFEETRDEFLRRVGVLLHMAEQKSPGTQAMLSIFLVHDLAGLIARLRGLGDLVAAEIHQGDERTRQRSKRLGEQPILTDLISSAVAVKDYSVSRATLRRAVEDKRLRDYRPEGHSRNAPLRLSRAEVASNWPKRGQ